MAAKSKAGRGGVRCARAPRTPHHSRAIVVVVVVVVVMRGGQVARPDGRRLGPNERGASDHWRSHRPFLRHRLDDRSCPSTASRGTAPVRRHCITHTVVCFARRQTGVAAAADGPITQVSLKLFFFFFMFFSNLFFLFILCVYINLTLVDLTNLFKKKNMSIFYYSSLAPPALSSSAVGRVSWPPPPCVESSSPPHGFQFIYFFTF